MIFKLCIGHKDIGVGKLDIGQKDNVAYFWSLDDELLADLYRVRLISVSADIMHLDGVEPSGTKFVYREWFLREANK
jgi:hypothetical protein